MASENVLSLKLVVDKEKNSLLFAESTGDFVDILFSFLTLPMGAIVRLLEKKSSLGCMDKLYEIVENLDKNHFQNEVCKSMLLFPRSAADILWSKLKIKVDDTEPLPWYGCAKKKSNVPTYTNGWCITSTPSDHLYSLVPDLKCSCGYLLTEKTSWSPNMSYCATEGGAFVKNGSLKFIITDDLQVMPASTANCVSLLQKFGTKDGSVVEWRTVQFGRDEIMSLLKRCLCSREPLSEVFFGKQPSAVGAAQINNTNKIKVEANSGRTLKKIKMEILEVKTENQFVYAETGEDFLNLLFSFLTLPLGSIIKLLNNFASIGSVNTLYKSIELLGGDCFKSNYFKLMLLDPKLAPHFDISNPILNVAADSSYSKNAINPKLPTPGTQTGGGFMKNSSCFIVTKDLAVLPFSLSTGLSLVTELKLPITKLGKRVVEVGEAEALKLLMDCVISGNLLGGVCGQ